MPQRNLKLMPPARSRASGIWIRWSSAGRYKCSSWASPIGPHRRPERYECTAALISNTATNLNRLLAAMFGRCRACVSYRFDIPSAAIARVMLMEINQIQIYDTKCIHCELDDSLGPARALLEWACSRCKQAKHRFSLRNA
jgi:hypothetical protein